MLAGTIPSGCNERRAVDVSALGRPAHLGGLLVQPAGRRARRLHVLEHLGAPLAEHVPVLAAEAGDANEAVLTDLDAYPTRSSARGRSLFSGMRAAASPELDTLAPLHFLKGDGDRSSPRTNPHKPAIVLAGALDAGVSF